MRISDWSSDVCSSDLAANGIEPDFGGVRGELITVVGVCRGEGQHWLLRRPGSVQRLADTAQGHSAPTHEIIEVAPNRFHLLIVNRRFFGVNDIAPANYPKDRVDAGNPMERNLELQPASHLASAVFVKRNAPPNVGD